MITEINHVYVHVRLLRPKAPVVIRAPNATTVVATKAPNNGENGSNNSNSFGFNKNGATALRKSRLWWRRNSQILHLARFEVIYYVTQEHALISVQNKQEPFILCRPILFLLCILASTLIGVIVHFFVKQAVDALILVLTRQAPPVRLAFVGRYQNKSVLFDTPLLYHHSVRV